MKLDLDTLKQVKFMFEIHSDHSAFCNGYRSLCSLVDEQEKLALESSELSPFDNPKYYIYEESDSMYYYGTNGWGHHSYGNDRSKAKLFTAYEALDTKRRLIKSGKNVSTGLMSNDTNKTNK